MNPAVVLRRTAKGGEALLTRAPDLERRLRNVLILVNGSSSVAELCAKNAGMAGLPECLQALLEQGMVEPAPAASVDEVREELIRIARSVLGDDAPQIVAQLEAAQPTRDALLETVARCRKRVLLLIDEDKAQSLMRRCKAALDRLQS